MGGFSPIHWMILAVVVLLIFGGGGKISSMMGDFAKGIKSFKKNMADDESMIESRGEPDGRSGTHPSAPSPGSPSEHIAPPHGAASPPSSGTQTTYTHHESPPAHH